MSFNWSENLRPSRLRRSSVESKYSVLVAVSRSKSFDSELSVESLVEISLDKASSLVTFFVDQRAVSVFNEVSSDLRTSIVFWSLPRNLDELGAASNSVEVSRGLDWITSDSLIGSLRGLGHTSQVDSHDTERVAQTGSQVSNFESGLTDDGVVCS